MPSKDHPVIGQSKGTAGPRGLATHTTVVVQMRPGARAAAVSAVRATATTAGAQAGIALPQLGLVSYTVPVSRVDTLIASLRDTLGVASVRPAATRQLFGSPNDLYFAGQLGYLNDVNAPAAWDRTTGSSSVKIAVVDSGVDVTHPDLSGKIADTYNAVTGSTDVTDAIGHGTMVAGVAAASTNNSIGVAGAGYDASILAVKVADSNNLIDTMAESAGIIWAVDHGARVINLSLGSPSADPTETNAVAYAVSHGVVVVAAAGNSGAPADGNPVEYPAALPGVLAVGGTDPVQDVIAPFSNHGSYVDVAAPAVGIVTTSVGGTYTNAAAVAGTSFSSPLVAGQAALLAAAQPSATAAQIQSAIVSSAHGYAGTGLGAGIVDFNASLDHLAPATVPTITAPTAAAQVGGVVTITATSSAQFVQFKLTSGSGTTLLGAPVPVTAGTATTTWTSYGYLGAKTFSAVDCSNAGTECSTADNQVAVTVANDAPVVTAPVAGAVVSGTFALGATGPGSAVRFTVDGVTKGTDTTAPYSVTITTSLLDGSHTAAAVLCNATGTVCEGPTSAGVAFTSKSLHPSIPVITPSAFSPNGDKVRDTARVTISLPDAERASMSLTNAAGTVVFGPTSLGVLAAGSHYVTLLGKSNTGARLANGTYTVVVVTSRTSGTTVLRGIAARTVRVDTSAPTLTSIVGSGSRIYPVVDGYRDTVAPAVTMSEAGTLSLVIRNSRGAVIRTVSIVRSAPGHYAIAWNGRTSTGAYAPAGSYTFRFVATDLAGNKRTSSAYPLVVSLLKLVAKTATLYRNGNAASLYYYNGSCDTASSNSDFANGVWLYNGCDPDLDGNTDAAASYRFALPSAVSYTSVQLSAYGFSYYTPTVLIGRLYNVSTGNYDVSGGWTLGNSTKAWFAFGTKATTGYVSSTHVVMGLIDVPNYVGSDFPPYDFDVAQVRLVVKYKVLG